MPFTKRDIVLVDLVSQKVWQKTDLIYVSYLSDSKYDIS